MLFLLIKHKCVYVNGQCYTPNNFYNYIASGRKLTVGNKRPGNLGVMNKSQTLPRSMGSKAVLNNGSGTSQQRPAPKPAATPPAIRRQFSVIEFSILLSKDISYSNNITFNNYTDTRCISDTKR